MKTYAFELDNVSAGYDGKKVFENLSLAVAEGETVALLGPNGAGKSTLLRTLTGILKPSDSTRFFTREYTQLTANCSVAQLTMKTSVCSIIGRL